MSLPAVNAGGCCRPICRAQGVFLRPVRLPYPTGNATGEQVAERRSFVMPFESPNHTQTPNDLFESLMQQMTEAELKVTLAVIRGTLGYHRDGFDCSLRKMTAIKRPTGALYFLPQPVRHGKNGLPQPVRQPYLSQ